jgi:membrane-associated phospholipid phosphatase
MDAIAELDWGVYAHFDFKPHPGVVRFMQYADALSGYIGVGILLAIAVMLFLLQGKRRSALVALASVGAAIGLIQAARYLVPRPRPHNAENVLAAQEMLGSYPSPSVFLFMLMMILIGLAVWDLARRPWQRGLYVVVAAALTVWVCMSQFFLALHFLSDVLGAMAGAALVGWGAYRFIPTK